MPYISASEREAFTIRTSQQPQTVGQLNYGITYLIMQYLTIHAESYQIYAESYQIYNDIMGVLACAQQEIYRRYIADYKDQKLNENGDVYG